MAFYTRERHIADLHEAIRAAEYRPPHLSVAGAAAVASGRATTHQPRRWPAPRRGLCSTGS